MDQGDRVRIGQRGKSVFVVVGRDEEDPDRVIIESIEESAPGRYPFSTRESELVPISEPEPEPEPDSGSN